MLALGLLALLVFAGQAALTYFSLRLHYEMRWYKVTDRSLRIRAGIWNVREMTMTFANVQNISITQGPLERLFGIWDVRVETAGGGSQRGAHGHGEGFGANLHTAVFRGVDDAEPIRDMMLARLRRARGAGLGDLDDVHGLEQSPRRAFGYWRQNGDVARSLSRRGQGAAPGHGERKLKRYRASVRNPAPHAPSAAGRTRRRAC